MKKKTYGTEYVDKLRNAYIVERKSTTEIAKDSINIFGASISPATIYKDIVNNNIPLRSKSESVSMAMGELDKNKTYMTENIIEWVDGLMLGDGYINFKKPLYTTSRVRIDSSSKEWVIYGLSKLVDYRPSEPKVYGKISKRCPNEIWMSTTLTHPDIFHQAERWYSGVSQTKVVPSDVRITPTSILLWYLGDGSLTYIEDCNTYIVRFATCAFPIENIENIIIPKLTALGLECSRDKSKNDIRICASSIGRFFDIIGHKSPIACYDHKFDIPDWLRLIRLSDIVEDDKQRWMAQYYYKTGQIECTKSPGGKMLLFSRDQANKLKIKLGIK